MKYKTVIITGASSGLGEEFARQIAPDAEALVLVARREERLVEIRDELVAAFPQLQVAIECVDLNDNVALGGFCEKLSDGTYIPHVLINNAGVGDLGCFEKSDWPTVEAMIHLNMTVLTQVAHAVVAPMKNAGGGFILNVSSMASIMPIPDFAVYAATKAYVTSLSEAIRLELREENIHVTALCPGPVKTEFGERARRASERQESDMKDFAYVSKERCVREGLNTMDARRATVFPGSLIKLATTGFKLLPMPLLRALMGRRPRRSD